MSTDNNVRTSCSNNSLVCALAYVFVQFIIILTTFFQVEKVVTGSPANEAGLQVHDFINSVQGQEVFECTHGEVVKIIRQAGNCLNISVER